MTPEEKLEAWIASIRIPKHKERELRQLFAEVKPKPRKRAQK